MKAAILKLPRILHGECSLIMLRRDSIIDMFLKKPTNKYSEQAQSYILHKAYLNQPIYPDIQTLHLRPSLVANPQEDHQRESAEDIRALLDT